MYFLRKIISYEQIISSSFLSSNDDYPNFNIENFIFGEDKISYFTFGWAWASAAVGLSLHGNPVGISAQEVGWFTSSGGNYQGTSGSKDNVHDKFSLPSACLGPNSDNIIG